MARRSSQSARRNPGLRTSPRPRCRPGTNTSVAGNLTLSGTLASFFQIAQIGFERAKRMHGDCGFVFSINPIWVRPCTVSHARRSRAWRLLRLSSSALTPPREPAARCAVPEIAAAALPGSPVQCPFARCWRWCRVASVRRIWVRTRKIDARHDGFVCSICQSRPSCPQQLADFSQIAIDESAIYEETAARPDFPVLRSGQPL